MIKIFKSGLLTYSQVIKNSVLRIRCARADPAGRFGGANWSGPQPNLPPKSDFSSDFGHFILKI